MIIDKKLFMSDFSSFKLWIFKKSSLFDYLMLSLLIGVFAFYIICINFLTNVIIMDVILCTMFPVIWTIPFIWILWINEQSNIKRYKQMKDHEIKLILRTRTVELFVILGCFQSFFFFLMLLNNYFYTKNVLDYNLLWERVILLFCMMIIYNFFCLTINSYIQIRFGNYLKFIYFELIPKQKPFTITSKEYSILIRKLKKPYSFNFLYVELFVILMTLLIPVFNFPIAIYILIIGNVPPLNTLPGPNNYRLVLFYTPYSIIFFNGLFIVVGIIFWLKLPNTLRTISEKFYTIPSQYSQLLLRINPDKENYIINLQENNYLNNSPIN